MAYSTVIYTKKQHVASVVLNRPGEGNAVDGRMAQELAEVCELINRDDDVYAATLTGRGGAFCRGVEVGSDIYRNAASIAGIEKPIIAAINGDALGEGLEIALAGDIRLVSTKARLGLSQITQGRMPSDGGTQRLARIVGRGKAMELLLTGDIISADEALEMGLVSRVVPPEALEEETQELAETIAGKGPIALRYLKEAVNKGMDMTLEQGLRLEADLYFLLHTTADRTEGIKAFREKRKPEFKGE